MDARSDTMSRKWQDDDDVDESKSLFFFHAEVAFRHDELSIVPLYSVNHMFQMNLQPGSYIAGWSTYSYYGYTTVLSYACMFVLHRYRFIGLH